VENPLGSPLNNLALIDCVRKFFDCAEFSSMQISKDKLEQIAEKIMQLERVEDPTEVIGLVRGS
jgi:hypothetical protein